MIHTALSLTILLITLAYIGLWLLIAFLSGVELLRRQAARNAARRLGSLEEKQPDGTSVKPLSLLVLLTTFLAGAALAWLALGKLQPVLLLAGLLILGLILEELRESPRLVHLPVTLGLLEGLRASDRQDVFTALQEVAGTLPPGKVQSAVMEAVIQHAGGMPPEQSMDALKGINPYLDELVVDLRNAGWQAGPTLKTALTLLSRRASDEWSAVGQRRLFVERIRPLIAPVRALLIGAMLVVSIKQVQQLDLNELRATLLASAIIAVGFLGVLLHYIFTRPWLRRALGTSILVTLLLLSLTFFQDVTPEVIPVMAATISPAAVETVTLTFTPPPAPMLTYTATSTPPLAPGPTRKPATDIPRDPSQTPLPTSNPTNTLPPPPSNPTNTPPPPPPTNPPLPTNTPSMPTDTPPPPTNTPSPDTPPPAPEDATNTPPPAPGGD